MLRLASLLTIWIIFLSAFCRPVYYKTKNAVFLLKPFMIWSSISQNYWQDTSHILALHTLLVTYYMYHCGLCFACQNVYHEMQHCILVGCTYKYRNMNSRIHLNVIKCFTRSSMQIWNSFFLHLLYIFMTSVVEEKQEFEKDLFCRVAVSLVDKLQ